MGGRGAGLEAIICMAPLLICSGKAGSSCVSAVAPVVVAVSAVVSGVVVVVVVVVMVDKAFSNSCAACDSV